MRTQATFIKDSPPRDSGETDVLFTESIYIDDDVVGARLCFTIPSVMGSKLGKPLLTGLKGIFQLRYGLLS